MPKKTELRVVISVHINGDRCDLACPFLSGAPRFPFAARGMEGPWHHSCQLFDVQLAEQPLEQPPSRAAECLAAERPFVHAKPNPLRR